MASPWSSRLRDSTGFKAEVVLVATLTRRQMLIHRQTVEMENFMELWRQTALMNKLPGLGSGRSPAVDAGYSIVTSMYPMAIAMTIL